MIFLREQRPFIDTRAPVEFLAGHVPRAQNLPLLTDRERELVGTCYKLKGQEAAISLGHDLVSGPAREQRLEMWVQFFHQNPNSYLYCFRGGLRSQLVQKALAEQGIDVPLVPGGYKALRRFYLKVLEANSLQRPMFVVTGLTGSGKTSLLRELHNLNDRWVCDLESLASHRGSAFGHRPAAQPSPATFENALADRFYQLRAEKEHGPFLILEDESRCIGKCSVPDGVFERMSTSPLLLINADRPTRARHLISEYLSDYPTIREGTPCPEEALSRLTLELEKNITSIEKRLGGLRSTECRQLIQKSLQAFAQTSRFESHQPWVEYVLENYYDPIYSRHIEAQSHRIVFRGTETEVRDWIVHQQTKQS